MSEISNRVFVTMNPKNHVDFDSILVLISRTLGLYFTDVSTFFLNLDALELRKGQKTCEFRWPGNLADTFGDGGHCSDGDSGNYRRDLRRCMISESTWYISSFLAN
ncbi:hypothetical protein Hanom_Chr16g01458521 [Helianthus anomalus]